MMLPPGHGGLRALDDPHSQGRHQLEPINAAIAGNAAAIAGNVGRTAAMEDRLMFLEQRLLTTERTAAEVSRAFDIQTQRVAAMSTEFARSNSELSDLRLRFEAAHGTASAASASAQQLGQQVMAMAADMRAQDTKLAQAQAGLSEALRGNAELRGALALLQDEAQRSAADRAAAQAAMERMARQFQEGVGAMASEHARAQEAADAGFREDARRRQAQHLADLQSLNREVRRARCVHACPKPRGLQ